MFFTESELKEKTPAEMGAETEEYIRQSFLSQGVVLQRPDFILLTEGEHPVCIEVKARTKQFKTPAFTGYGLNKKQIKLRQQLWEYHNIPTFLIIREPTTHMLFCNYLNILLAGISFEQINKKTGEQFVVFPIENFNKIDPQKEIEEMEKRGEI